MDDSCVVGHVDDGQGATGGRRVASFPLAWLVAAFTLAQLVDLVSALVVARELNRSRHRSSGDPCSRSA
jgi:hypothetical protein